MRLERERSPDAADRALTHPGRGRHRACRPVRRVRRLLLERLHDHPLDVLVADRARLARPHTSEIIYSRVLHQLMGRVATANFLDLIWSDELILEARCSLIGHKGLSPETADYWVGHLGREFPRGRVDIWR